MYGMVQDKLGHYASTDYLNDKQIVDAALGVIERRWANTGSVIGMPSDVSNYFKLRLGDSASEVFAVMFLDTKHRVIKFEVMFHGTIDGCAVYIREILRKSLLLNAAAVIIGHIHPSGSAEASQADRELTKRISEALAFVDIRLLDHIIVCSGTPFSFAQRGLI
jgi:DNA repair protein RadC